jgi:hypothetical protein
MTPPAAAAAAPAVRPLPRRAPARPGAPSRPARSRPGAPARPRRAPAPARRVAGARLPALPTGRLRVLDGLIASRAWIGVVAFALIGIVAMQLWLLKLNTGIGRAIEHEALLQRTNAALSAENSAQSAGDLVESKAIAAGMTIVPPGALVFLRARGSVDEREAAARLAQPVSSQTTTASSTATTQASPDVQPEVAPSAPAQPEAQGQGG